MLFEKAGQNWLPVPMGREYQTAHFLYCYILQHCNDTVEKKIFHWGSSRIKKGNTILGQLHATFNIENQRLNS